MHKAMFVINVYLVGDSAHTINPLAGQGVNLGFKDVAAMLDVTQGQEVLTLAQFQRYERRRRPDNLLMQPGWIFSIKRLVMMWHR